MLWPRSLSSQRARHSGGSGLRWGAGPNSEEGESPRARACSPLWLLALSTAHIRPGSRCHHAMGMAAEVHPSGWPSCLPKECLDPGQAPTLALLMVHPCQHIP